MLIDDVTIEIKGGAGGRGAVAFDKNKLAIGPSGGRGGNGGSIYAEGVADLGALNHFRYKKKIEAEKGGEGRSQFRDGTTGKDSVIEVPVGTVIYNLTNSSRDEITKIGERILLARGGSGGKGNFHFRSPRNTSPKEFQPGTPGEHFTLRLELKMIADVGLIGLPNVGKSSWLNTLTNAKSKVANYQFTTLEPHLGVYYELILADIPGLIEGAHEGKGLGIKFLRHIERTRVLFHFISAESDNPKKDYDTIRKELSKYNPALAEKDEYVFLSKKDIPPEKETILKAKKLSEKIKKTVLPVSVIDDKDIKEMQRILNGIKDEKIKK